MARKARIHIPGVFQHVTARGIEGRDIFADEDDRHCFLRFLDVLLTRWGHQCYAWALMPNHYHLVLRVGEQPLGFMMRQLNSTYARYFSKQHDRHGYLFQDRFKSVATQDQNYVLEMVRYVHLNPIRAGLCNDLRELASYRWTGHPAVMGKGGTPFQDCKALLHCFAAAPTVARAKYESFIEAGLRMPDDDGVVSAIRRSNTGVEARGDTGCWVIGAPAFVRRALAQDSIRRARVARYARQNLDLKSVLRIASRMTKVKGSEILTRKRTGAGAEARKVFCL